MSLWPFKRAVATIPPEEEPEPSTSFTQPDKIEHRSQIARVLDQLIENRCVLAVSFTGVDDNYSSAVIEVVRNDDYLVIDELAPRAVNQHVTVGQEVTIRARMNNVTVRFTSTVSGIGNEDGLAYYRLPFPASLDYVQRREHYRAGVPLEKKIPVQLALTDGTLHNAELRDVSLGGFSARLIGALPNGFTPGNTIKHLIIVLPGASQIHGSGQICYAELAASSRVSRCGVRFLRIDRVDQNTLAQFIAQLDREMKRKHLR
ncbi:MAG: flagellar regulator YcgR PilZN domain-containing protein [Gammaproteobacteria bacterium]